MKKLFVVAVALSSLSLFSMQEGGPAAAPAPKEQALNADAGAKKSTWSAYLPGKQTAAFAAVGAAVGYGLYRQGKLPAVIKKPACAVVAGAATVVVAEKVAVGAVHGSASLWTKLRSKKQPAAGSVEATN